MCEQPAITGKYELLSREPPHALHKAALDLADVDRRIERSPAIIQDVDPHDAILAGQCVDNDLRAGSPVREIVEWPSGRGRAIPCDLWRAVIGGFGQMNASFHALFCELTERDRFVADENPIVSE